MQTARESRGRRRNPQTGRAGTIQRIINSYIIYYLFYFSTSRELKILLLLFLFYFFIFFLQEKPIMRRTLKLPEESRPQKQDYLLTQKPLNRT